MLELDRPTDKISLSQYAALTLTGLRPGRDADQLPADFGQRAPLLELGVAFGAEDQGRLPVAQLVSLLWCRDRWRPTRFAADRIMMIRSYSITT